MYNPWLDAFRRYPEVHIEWHALGTVHALWSPGHDVILVNESISRAERRCALAHELAHMDTGDRPTEDCWISARQETAADRLAARRLVDVNDLANVIRWCRDPREVAEELEVTLAVLALRGAMMHPAERGLIDLVLSCREAVA